MSKTHEVPGINHMPIYLISSEHPFTVDESDYIDDTPINELLNRLGPTEHLYFVDIGSVPGMVRLTRLA